MNTTRRINSTKCLCSRDAPRGEKHVTNTNSVNAWCSPPRFSTVFHPPLPVQSLGPFVSSCLYSELVVRHNKAFIQLSHPLLTFVALFPWNTVVSAAIQFCEHLTSFQDEIQLIWPRPWRSRLTSWLFVYTRYSPYVINYLHASYPQPTFSTINLQIGGYLVFIAKITTTQLMFLIIQYILSKRLTLFYRGTWIRVFVLPGFMIARSTLVFCLAFGEAHLELIMLGFMVFAYCTKNDSGRNPVTHRLRKREGLGVPIFSLITMAIALEMQLVGEPVSLTIYPIYLGLMSSLACRLILSNHKVIQAFVANTETQEYRLANSRL
ncbi:hypothetical protein NP233_g6876 [Leucocoprinus birnbaumii]|uniref:DUF6533 domain-containing protein n=1 Tax=Leucocoprinus birnbaumii TaxID=56174 RepID=A0AAD5VQD6_9AGAR|nr:hypothetical protein NP233_g6876 [Leucocoprinus birnbaumii]